MTYDYTALVERQRHYFNRGFTQSYQHRVEALKKLRAVILSHEHIFVQALQQDLGKSPYESYISETGFCLQEIRHTLKKLKSWMKPQRVATPMLLQPARSRIVQEPLGVTLIIGPYNYPINLVLSPLIAAIAAGNTAIIKFSECVPTCSRALAESLTNTFDDSFVAVVEGGREESTALLQQPFDHIFFTGSARVGKIVMQAAARHLAKVTLELGGKSPCIVHDDAKLDLAVKRIVFGKFLNAGQTCVAPDYVLVHQSIYEDFLTKISARIALIYGNDSENCEDFGRIVNAHHWQRICALIDAKKVVVGGESNALTRFIAPTVLRDVRCDDAVMADEIFGPVLPVLPYATFDDIRTVTKRCPQHPLACYVFSESHAFQSQIAKDLQFGGLTINHCIQHLVNPNLPFGGVGMSGLGVAHGVHGFRCFSHGKSILKAATWIDHPLIYPPYKNKLRWIKMLMR